MKRILILILAGLVTGCVTPPQTVDELREGVKKGAAFTKMEKQEVMQSFNKTFEAIKINADKCLNVTVTGSTPGTYGPVVSSIRYRSHSTKTGKNTAEMVLQQDARATGKMPEGGYFVMLTDMESTASNHTRLTIYGGSTGYDNVYTSILAWAQGQKIGCPKFPMGGFGYSYTYHDN